MARHRDCKSRLLFVVVLGRPDEPPGAIWKYNPVSQLFSRWAKKRRWQAIFEGLREEIFLELDLDWVMIDSSVLWAPQHAAGQKSSADAEAAGLLHKDLLCVMRSATH